MGGWRCRRPILVTCGSALSQLWRPVRRDARGSRAFRGQRGVGGKVAAALVSAEERRPGSRAWRERFAVGRVRGRDFGSDRPTAGPDLGRNGCRTAQATDQNQLQLALAFSRPTQHHAQKKCCKQPNGSEQMWARARRRWIREQGMLDPARLVFIDETAVSTNMVRLERASPAWRPGDWRRSAWKMGDDHLRGRSASQ